jgi:hypothetical protein
MKPLAFAADAGELIFIYGFSMAVSLFDRLRSARSQIVEKCRYSTAKPIIAQNTNLESRPAESHREPLTEPDMNLSAHPAPHQANTPVIPIEAV